MAEQVQAEEVVSIKATIEFCETADDQVGMRVVFHDDIDNVDVLVSTAAKFAAFVFKDVARRLEEWRERHAH